MTSSATKTLDLTRPVKTRGGHPVRIVDTNYRAGIHDALIVAIHHVDGCDSISCHYVNGMVNKFTEHYRDLLNEPTNHKVVVYRSGDGKLQQAQHNDANVKYCEKHGLPFKIFDVEVDF